MFCGDLMFGVAFFFFIVIFVIVISIFVITAVKSFREWNRNNHSPRLTVDAMVAAKRADVSHHSHAGDSGMSTSSTTYYVTFQVDSGDRMELHVSGEEYGMLVEGDMGRLTFQGTRYLGFQRR